MNDEGGFATVTIVGSTIYYSTSTRKVLALDKSSGKILWSINLNKTVAGTPVVYRGLVIFGEWDGALRAVDQSTGKSVTSFETGRGVTSMPTINEETNSIFVMTVDANLFALKLKLEDQSEYLPWEL